MSQKVIFLMTERTCAFSTTKTRAECPRWKNCQFVLVVSKVQGQKVIIKQANYFFFSVFCKGKMWIRGEKKKENKVGMSCCCLGQSLPLLQQLPWWETPQGSPQRSESAAGWTARSWTSGGGPHPSSSQCSVPLSPAFPGDQTEVFSTAEWVSLTAERYQSA